MNMNSADAGQPAVLPITEILRIEDALGAVAGGKARGLSRLLAMGLPVPAAFVIRNAHAGPAPAGLAAAYAALGEGNVAVRSSAADEDGAGASFAGQYESILNVCGIDALQQAIASCVASLGNARATHYRESTAAAAEPAMHVVVQRMVDARVAGVVFTADPASARRDLLVIDAVAGLGESLVSGQATPDHYAIDSAGQRIRTQLAGEHPLLNEAEIAGIAAGARQAALAEGQPLDLEWAIDHAGRLFWLQARPITTLPADLNEFDTVLPRADDVLTTCNVSEMMPGAVCPLTGSFTGWGIDYGLQHMQLTVGARARISPEWQITASAFGHLFLNLTGNVSMAAGVLGSTVEQTAQTLCGRIVPELRPVAPLPGWRRLFNTFSLLRYCLGAPATVRQFGLELDRFVIREQSGSARMWAELEAKAPFFEHCMAVHIQSSALSGFLCAIVENMVAGRSNDSTAAEQARAAALLGGAKDVESAVMLQQLDTLVSAIAAHPDATASFCAAEPATALAWLRATAPLADEFTVFLGDHGHRGYRELCMRDPAWADDPSPLVQSMQAAVHAHLATGGHRARHHAEIDWHALPRALRWLLPRAHDAIRRREHTKSQLVDAAHRFKRGFRHLGTLLAAEGKLPDPDLLFFFSMQELPAFVASPDAASVAQAVARRHAFAYQQRLEFPEISVGRPQPLEPRILDTSEGQLLGRPASRGRVQGLARVAHTLAEAAALQPGEILVTPITDIGWTPYFSLIGGLVTDLGSSVSHGAVIAREYGLPCVVNTRNGTRFFKTGERIELDGDSGIVRRL